MSKVKTTKKQVIEVKFNLIKGIIRRLIKPTSFDRIKERSSHDQKIEQEGTQAIRI